MKFKHLAVAIAVVATAAWAAPAMAALTQTEIHQYFCGGGTDNPGDDVPAFVDGCDTIDTPVIVATPGSTLWIPIWITPLQGDNPGATAVTAAFFEVHGVEGDGVSGDDFLPRDGHLWSGVFGNGGDPRSDGLAGDLSAGTVGVRYMQIMGAAVGTGSPMGSDGAGDEREGGVGYYIGWLAVDVSMQATTGDTLELSFNTPREGANKYATSSTTGSRNTVGYGYDSVGPGDAHPNRTRITSTNNDVLGTVNNHFSSIADLRIEVVPEPTTLGLLALGLLGFRRVRRCA